MDCLAIHKDIALRKINFKGEQKMREKITIISLLFFFSVLFLQAQQSLAANPSNSEADSAKSSNRIAVAAVGDSANSEISTISGRAPYYLIFDGNGVFLKSIKNPGQSRGGRASSAVVDMLLKESCNIVMAGKFGDKMTGQLKANKIEYYVRTGTAREVVQKFIKDKGSKDAQK